MKTHTINPITWKHYSAFMLIACWAMGATVLSYDRILYHVAVGIGNKADMVAAKYAPPVNRVVQTVEVPTEQEKQLVLGGEYIMTDETMAKLIGRAVK